MSERRKRVGLLFGGASVEHEVSVVSARGVAAALDAAKFECVCLAVTGDGRWLLPEAGAAVLAAKAPRVEAPAPDPGGRIVVDPGGGGLVAQGNGEGTRSVPIDVVFSVMHGWGGEDGRVQGLLELAGVPYVGAGVLGSAVGMDKRVAKQVFEAHGLPVGPWLAIDRDAWSSDPRSAREAVGAATAWPVFVKPANGGSSVGISKVKAAQELDAALEEAFRHDRTAVVEQGLDVREIEVAVLGNGSPEASVPGEIVPSNEFYDYAAKYLDNASTLRIPAPLDAATAQRVRTLAIEAFRALDLAGLARVDFFLENGSGKLFVNEVNTLPGFTPISMYPKLWEATGLAYPLLLERLIELALERADDERRRATRRGGHGG
ncbi:MAG TPA: D-alanine--D-alanine ligase family protein [Candidatus Polarisedimenticolaceae bacterium]